MNEVRHSKSVVDKWTQVSRVFFPKNGFLSLVVPGRDRFIRFIHVIFVIEGSPISQNQGTNNQGCYVVLIFCSCYVRFRVHVHVMLSILLKSHRLVFAYGCLCYIEVKRKLFFFWFHRMYGYPSLVFFHDFLFAHVSTMCSRGAFRVVRCPSSVVRRQQFL